MARPFLATLRQAAPHAEVVFASSGITGQTRRELCAAGCRLLPYRYLRAQIAGRKIWPGNTRWHWWHRHYAAWINRLPGLSPAAALRWRARVARHFLDPNTRRFLEFYLNLGPRLAGYDRVLITDVRDVVFQADPFALLAGEGILYGLEDSSQTIGTQWANSLWLAQVAGPAVRDELAAARISCVGVVLGSGRVMAEYLRLMVEALTRPGINVANFHGADTGAHNLVVHRGRLPRPRYADLDTGGILNLHGLNPACLRWTDDGLLADRQGRPFAVVHQYDRHPEITARLLPRLGTAPAPHASTDRFFQHT